MEKSRGEKNGKLKVAILYCQHSVGQGRDIAADLGREKEVSIYPSMLPCSSKLQLSHVLKILDEKADGVEVVACADNSCSFLVGSCRAGRRISFGRQMLDRIKVGGDRLGITQKSGLTGMDLRKIARERAHAVKAIMLEGDKV
ncbi:hydrogenase iron-sulfur subunit [Fibrobacterota bacterium]